MVNPDFLAKLKDIHSPTPIGWWPLAPGWYVIILFILTLFIILLYRFYRNYCHAKAKKHALVLLTNYQKQYEKDGDVSLASAHVSELLRRVALAYYPREEVASLCGEDWLRFLNETGKNIDFNLVKDMLLNAPFKVNQTLDLNPLFNVTQVWIKQRSVPCSK